jgi:hypothetical protein
MLILMMQYVISTKAGLVNYVEGEATAKVGQNVEAGQLVRTGSNAYAEILLNPGSFLWLGSNSEIVFDSTQLTEIVVRVVSGTAMIEASGVSKKVPIKVSSGNLTTEIVDNGLYLFSDGTATVFTGKLRTAHSKDLVKKGWRIALTDRLQATKTSKNSPPTPVQSWSRGRAELIAQANRQTYDSLGFRSEMLSNIWLFNPVLGFWTFMPHHSYRSPYGYRYYSVVREDYRNTYAYSGGDSGSSASTRGGQTGTSVSGDFGNSSVGVGEAGSPPPAVERTSDLPAIP